MNARFLIALATSLLLVASCSSPPELTGKWDGQDWGVITFVGGQGTYSSTFGGSLGQILLEPAGNGEFKGTWSEGTKRFGTLQLAFKGKDALVGKWTADPASEIKGSAGGAILWTRKPKP
ncbi:MAG: hypothetical protein JNK75_13075 [Betaproteobacteria bacterium]|nr:hypothetical protein [Betaproteobacteria bacterium]